MKQTKKNHSFYSTEEIEKMIKKHAKNTNRSFNGMLTEMAIDYDRRNKK